MNRSLSARPATLLLVGATLLAALTATSSTNAAPLAQDAFLTGTASVNGEYASGAALGNQGPTLMGFTGSWLQSTGGGTVQGASLSYSAFHYGAPAGGALLLANEHRVSRLFNSAASGLLSSSASGTVYISFLAKFGGNGLYNWSCLELGGDGTDTTKALSIGIVNGTGLGFQVNASSLANHNLTSGAAVDTGAHLFLVRIDLGGSPGSDAVTMWKDPVLGGAGDPSGGTTATGIDLRTISRLQFGNWSGFSSLFDEVRIGTTLADVLTSTPVVVPSNNIPVTSVQTDADGATLTMSPGKLKLTVCSDSVIRVMYSPTATLPTGQTFVTKQTWPAATFQVTQSASSVTVATAKTKVVVNKTTGALQFFDATDRLLLEEPADGGKMMPPATVNGESAYQPQQVFKSPGDEFLYGLGQYQEGTWNWRGIPQQLRQVNTQIAIPMVVSSYGYGVLWHNAALTEFNPADNQVALTSGTGTFTTGAAGDYVFIVKDGNLSGLIGVQVNGQTVASIANTWVPYTISGKIALPASTACTVTLLGGGSNAKIYARPLGNTTTFRSEVGDAIDYYFFYGPTADEVVAGYRDATGDAPLFPKAAYGFWQCRERYSSQSQILDAAAQFRARNIPVDYIVQDWQYWGSHGWGAYQWDASNYPDPAGMISQLHADHFKYMISVWSNPEGIVGDALAAMPNGRLPGTTWMDVYHPAVRSLRWDYMNSAFFGIGADGFWQDATEPGDDGNAVSGRQCYLGSANRVRNAYPLFANRATYEGQRATDTSKRVVILSRSSYPGQQRYGAAVWSGDVKGDWTTFRRQIPAGLNYSITGQPYWTTDTAGFFHPSDQHTSPDYNELLTRWFQWSTFCPILRIHGYQSATEMWNWLPATQTNLLAFDHLRYRMLPYNYSVAWKITSERYTSLRPLMMDFPGDPNVLPISDQHMFGPAFLVCPVTTPQATTRSVYLPAGVNWTDLWSGETHQGGQTITANAPLDIMPLYVRAGSIVPFGPSLQYAMEKAADPIELRIYTGADGQFTLYEDEGDSYAYESDNYATIPLSWNDSTKTLTVGARQGSFPGMLAQRTFRVVWVCPAHGSGTPNDGPADALITYNGSQVSVSIPGSLSAPATPVITPAAGANQVTLAWSAPANASGYIVRRSLTSGGPYLTVATTATPGYTDTQVVVGSAYYYIVVAANIAGSSAPSAEVTGTPVSSPVGPARYWDVSSSSGLQGGNGTWDAGTTAAWSADTAGNQSLLVWANNGEAFFQSGAASTVTLGGSVQVHSINQSGAGTVTTITGGAGLQLSHFGEIRNGAPGGNGTLTINSPLLLGGVDADFHAEQPIRIGAPISDGGLSHGFFKTGPDTLTLTGANTYSGETVVLDGTLVLGGNAPINAVQSSVSISPGATLKLDVAGVGGTPGGDTMGAALSKTGADVTLSGGGTLAVTGGGPDVLGLGDTSGRLVHIRLDAGGVIDVQGGILRNGGWQAADWTDNRSTLNVATGAVFDLWDGRAVTVGALTGGGRVQNGSNSTSITPFNIGASDGSGTFSGIIGGGTRAGANRIALIKLGEGTQTLTGTASLASISVLDGAFVLSGGSLSVSGGVTNSGILRLAGGATLNVSGAFTNNGVLDVMAWGGSLPAGFVNNGTVLDRSAVKIDAVFVQSGVLSVTFTAYADHTYQLQATDSLSAATVWENIGSPIVGTGAPVTMTDSKPVGAKRFCRIQLDP